MDFLKDSSFYTPSNAGLQDAVGALDSLRNLQSITTNYLGGEIKTRETFKYGKF